MLLEKFKNYDIYKLMRFFFLIEIFIFLTSGILTSLFPKLEFYKYLSDISFIIFMIIYLLKKGYKEKLSIPSIKKYTFIIFLLFVVFSIVSFLWSKHNITGAIIEARFYLISFIIFYLYSVHFNTLRFDYFLKYIHWIQIINLILVLHQYFIMKLHPDFCNGIFGFNDYNNAVQGIFCSALSIIAIVYFISNKWTWKKSFSLLLLNCLICAFSEIKAFFILIIIIFLVTFFIMAYLKIINRRFIGVILCVGLVFIVGIILLSIIMPENIKFMFNLNNYISYEIYGARDGAGRLNIYTYIINNIFNKDFFRIFFGMGIGTISNQFVYTSGKVFSSTGLIGTILLFSIFISIFIQLFMKRNPLSDNEIISIIFSIIVLISIFLWNCIFTNSAYFVFLILSLINSKTELVE